MSSDFFEKPILNSPYAYPARHWELDDEGQPTQQIIEHRRRAGLQILDFLLTACLGKQPVR